MLPRLAYSAAAALALATVLVSRGDRIDADLHLIAPVEAPAGRPVPLRARHYVGLTRTEGPVLSDAAVAVELRDAAGTVHARTRLRPGHANTLEGALTPPAGLVGTLRLRATTGGEGPQTRVERPLSLATRAATVQPLPRRLPPLSRLTLGPVRMQQPGPEAPAVTIEPQVAGGACVPEIDCTLYIHAEPAGLRVKLRANASLTPLEPEGAVADPVASLGLRCHGPEAQGVIEVFRGEELLASRSIRLPLALAADAARAQAPGLLPTGAQVSLELQGGADSCIADAFHEGHWRHSASLRPCDGQQPLAFGALSPGRWRIQLRRDPFSAETAAVRAFYVQTPGQSAAQALLQLAAAARQRAPNDALAAEVLAAPERHARAASRVAAYLLAILERGLVPMPAASSSYPLALAAGRQRHARVQKLALLVLAMAALALLTDLVRRALSAAADAHRIMAEAERPEAALAREQRRRLWRLALSGLSLLLAFAAIGVFVLALGGP
ncbi:MAG: hypothetical protein OEZ06_08265 [Myxococcales bacterium]|nr:hypothetical protein [Myxococcales bacterium]